MRAVANWIYDWNLPVFLATLGYIIGYQFDPAEVMAIEAGVAGSDGDANRWFSYSVDGSESACELQLAHDPGSCVVQVRLELPPIRAAQVEVAVYMCQCFHLRPGA